MDMALVTLPVKRRALVTTPMLNGWAGGDRSKAKSRAPARITPAFLAGRELDAVRAGGR